MKRIKTIKNLINELIGWDPNEQIRVSFMGNFGRPHQIYDVYKTYQGGHWYINILLKERKRRLK